jgi:long-chain acyl-CoA synthetase
LPLFHALAQMANLLLPLTVGARVVFLESVNTSELLRALRERHISAFCCVPQFFYLIHQRVAREVAAAGWLRRRLFRGLLGLNGGLRRLTGLNLGPYLFRRVHSVLGTRMRILVTGGSRFDPGVGRDLYRLGFDLLQAYGLTESCGGATLTRPGHAWDGSVGQPLPGVQVKILAPEAGAEGEAGDGEVAIGGSIVMQGYFNRADASTAVLRDGWLHTGDLGRLDEKGHLHITGRKKDVIVLSSGKNIYPEEIEAHYEQTPYVKEMCVVGLLRAEEPSAERLHAVVVPDFDVLREQKIVNAREIIRFEFETLSVQLPGHKRILSFEVWQEELPRTTTRKLKRFEIESRVRTRGEGAAGETAATAPPLGEEEAAWVALPEVAQALAVLAEMARVQGPVRPDANIELDLGLDSMERVELVTHLEKLFGTTLSDELASRIYTVRELVEAVRSGEKCGPRAETRGEQAWGRLLQEVAEGDGVLAD